MTFPKFEKLDVSFDDRGYVTFLNSFNFTGIKRFYIVENRSEGFIRAWHGHKLESKWFVPLSGSFEVGVVEFKEENTSNPAAEQASRFILDARIPGVLQIPAGFINGIKSLEANSVLLVFSDASIEDSLEDDFRFPFDFWNIWIERYR